MVRVRLDQLLVQRSLAQSRERAQALILSGSVRVDGEVADRAAQPVDEEAALSVEAGPRFVSRGGEKLNGALDDFGIAVRGRVVLDVGASTGGFTDCVLRRGAMRVYAIDVGRGQLAWRLRTDPRVVVREGVNARQGFVLPEPVDLIVADLSFISLRLALPPAFAHLRTGGDVVALVKPQFEAGREAVGRGGIVHEPGDRAAAVVAVCEAFAALGVGPIGIAASRLSGREGNREIFVHCRKGDPGLAPGPIRERAAEAAA